MREVEERADLAATRLSNEEIDCFDPMEREAYEWVARFAAGELTSADVEAVNRWCRQSPAHRAAYDKACRVWQGIGPAASAVTQQNGRTRETGSGLARLQPAISRRAMVGGGLAAAAAAGYLLVRPPFDLWPSYAEFMADYRTGIGEQRRLTVSDASLDMNTRTSVAIRSQTVDATRIELISGELAVATGATAAPLTVLAAEGRVVASKANFNLRYDGAEVRVSCLKGNLDVARTPTAISLTGGQQVDYGPQGIGAVTAIDPDSVTAWQRGILIFDAAPVARVIEEINRYRSGRIILMNREIGVRHLSAQLRIAEADEIIVQIVHIFGAKATALPGGVIILT